MFRPKCLVVIVLAASVDALLAQGTSGYRTGAITALLNPSSAMTCSNPLTTWYNPDLFLRNDGKLGLIAHASRERGAGCGWFQTEMDALWSASSSSSGPWQTPVVSSCPAVVGLHGRCGWSSDGTTGAAGPVGNPSVVKIGSKYFMAFNGGNADFFEGYIYWATSSNGVDWVVRDLNANDAENWTPLLSRNNRDHECPPAVGAFHEPELTYDATDTSMGSSGTFSLLASYCHYQSGAQDPCLVRDTWLFRFGYNPTASTGLGSTLQVWRDNGTLNGTWSNTSGRLVFDYDGQTVLGEPVLGYWDGLSSLILDPARVSESG